MSHHFPETRAAWARLMAAIAGCWEAWRVARYLGRRCTYRDARRLIRRNSDGTLWAPGCPQNFAYAMADLLVRFPPRSSFHFYRVREWRGVWVASRKVFWNPQGGEFTLLFDDGLFELPPWPEGVECDKIDERRRALVQAAAA